MKTIGRRADTTPPQPGPAEDDSRGERQDYDGRNDDAAMLGAGGDADERKRVCHASHAREERPASLTTRAEAARSDEARGDQADEADGARHQVQHAVPADRMLVRGRPGREAEGRVGGEQPGAEQPEAVQRDEPRSPDACRTIWDRGAHPKRRSDDEQAADDQ
jgi:hypothetical protein